LHLGGKARFNSAEDVGIILTANVPFAQKDVPHWIAFANPDAANYRDGEGIEDIFKNIKKCFDAMYLSQGHFQIIKLNEEEDDIYAEAITKLIKGRYSFDIIV
jgi:hypothetical protein